MDKQILAALEITDGNIRLIVGEFFNTRLNIIKVIERFSSGIVNSMIVNKELVTYDIEKIKEKFKKGIGIDIDRIILCIPSKDVTRYPLKIKVDIANENSYVTIDDINEGINLAKSAYNDQQRTLINVVCTKYFCNGIAYRKAPINEKCTELIMDVDLLCADTKFTYDYVSVVEDAGIKVMDIYLDTFAACKEASLLERSIKQNILLVKLERNTTTLTVLTEGHLASSKLMDGGINDFLNEINSKYKLKNEITNKLLKYNVNLFAKKLETSPIYLWTYNKNSLSVSEKDIYDTIEVELNRWIDNFINAAKPVFDLENTNVIIVGEGSELQNLDKLIESKINLPVSNYIPVTLGARSGDFVSALGALYAFKDKTQYDKEKISSLDIVKYEDILNKTSIDDVEETVTSKLKSIFEKRKEILDNESVNV